MTSILVACVSILFAAVIPFWKRRHVLPALLLAAGMQAYGGEAYYTGFENFTAGNDTIIGTDSWTGSYAGTKLHGVMSEAEHGVVGIGNAAVIGGYSTTLTKTGSGSSVYVAKAVNLDPVALNEEVATFSVVFGIKDSTTTKRDNFEFLIYNQSNALLAGIQFDNTTLDSSTSAPRRLIYRLSWNAATSSFQYVLTSYNFLPASLETLKFRINYRTNLWMVSLSDVPIFEDLPFYTGAATKNLGTVMVKMAVTNTTANAISPGDNYMLFDDFTVRTDPLYPAIQVEQPSGTALTSGGSTANFGSSLIGTAVPLTFTIRNKGEAPLTDIAVTRDGTAATDYTLTTAPTTPLAVGASTTFGVTFTPSASGSRAAALHIASNDPNDNPFDINLSGTGLAPEIAVEQPAGTNLVDGSASVGFGSIALGANASRTFTIKNTGSANLTGLAITRDGTNPADFTVTSAPVAPVAGPNGSTAFTVRFKPGAAGARAAVIHIASNDSNESPFDIRLTGTGIANPEIAVQQPAGTNLTDGVSTKSFGSVAVKSTFTRTFTIKNSGTGNLTNLAITKTGAKAKKFTVTPPSKTTLAPGASTTFKVTFKPTAIGSCKATLHIRNNDSNENPFDIKLTGKGIAAKASAAESAMSAADVSVGSSDRIRSLVSTLRIHARTYRCITIPLRGNGDPGQESVEVSSNLVDWFSGPRHTTVVEDTAEVLKVRDNTPIEPGNKRFIRLKGRP